MQGFLKNHRNNWGNNKLVAFEGEGGRGMVVESQTPHKRYLKKTRTTHLRLQMKR